MKMKKERDKSNAALIAQFEFFFTNGIIEQRFGDVWSIDYGKMLTAIAPDSAAVQLALASGDHCVSHTVYGKGLHSTVSILLDYFATTERDIRSLRSANVVAMNDLLVYLNRHRTRMAKFIEYAEWMVKTHPGCVKQTGCWQHSVLAMALAVTEECALGGDPRIDPTFEGLKHPEVLDWLAHVTADYSVDRYIFDRPHRRASPAAFAMVIALAAYKPLMDVVVRFVAKSARQYERPTYDYEHWKNTFRAAVMVAAHHNTYDLANDYVDRAVNTMNSIIGVYEVDGNKHCSIENTIFPVLIR